MLDADMQQYLFPLITVFVGVMGACVGSFLNVIVYRVPRGESLVSPPSHCPACGHLIPAWQNVPVLAWLFLRGRCHFCHGRISVRYPLVELSTALLFLATWLVVFRQGLPWVSLVRYCVFLAVLLAVSLTDLDCRLVPNLVTFPAMAWALATAALLPAATVLPGSLADGSLQPGLVTAGIEALVLEPAGILLGDHGGAILESAAGLATGIALLWAFRFVSQTIWGRRTRQVSAPVPFLLTPERFRLGEQYDGPPAAFLPPSFESVGFQADNLRLRTRGQAEEQSIPGRTEVTFSPVDVSIGTRSLPLAEIERLEGATAAWTFSRDVLGWGDIKLVGVCGAFLGPDACIFVIMLGALGASLAGLTVLAIRRRGGIVLPFAPFLASAAAIWFFFGKDLALLYGRVILGLHSGEMSL